MENREALWDSHYSKTGNCTLHNDIWIKKYISYIKPDDMIIELGCGFGLLSEWFIKNSFNILSTDISEKAIEKFRSRVPEARTEKIDIQKSLPYPDSSFDIVIADLCLHYFDTDSTEKILTEVQRILKYGGYLFARVNSDSDLNHGAGCGIKIEKGFYNQKGHFKRFFDREMIDKFFSRWKLLSVSEESTDHYIKAKNVYEIAAGNSKKELE